MKKSNLKSIITAFCFSTLLGTAQIRDYDLNFYGPGSGGTQTEFEAQHFTKSGNFYFVGGGKNFGTLATPLQDPVIVKLNANGTLAGLSQRYVMTGTQHSTHITAIESSIASNAGYLLSGISGAPGDDYVSNFLIKTDQSGNVIWKKSFRLTNSVGTKIALRIKQVLQIANGRVLIVGVLHNGNTTSSGTEMTIIRLDPFTGNFDWYKTYRHPSGSIADGLTPIGILEGPPGKIVIHGRTTQNHPSSSFIFSFQDSPTHGPALANLKMVGLNHQGILPALSTIESMHYYQGGYIVGGHESKIVSPISYQQIYLFRLNSNLDDPKSLNNIDDKTSSYLNGLSPHLTHITSNANGLILSGSLNTTGKSFVMLLGTTGSVINAQKGNVNIESSNTSVDCFTEPSGSFSTLHQCNDPAKKTRFTKYSSIGFAPCQNLNVPTSDPFNDNITIIDQAPLSASRLMEVLSPPTVTPQNFVVSVETICEGCSEAPVSGPITTSTGQNMLCGSPLTLNAPTGFSNHIWTLNGNAAGNGASINISEGGVYTVYMLDENGCQTQQTITITDYNGCSITHCPPDVVYCSLSPANIPTIGWNSNPLINCTGKWSFKWYYNGNLISGSSYNTPFQGPGLYSVVVLTPCGSTTCNINVTDQLIEYINHPSAQPIFATLVPGPTFSAAITPPAGFTYSWVVNNLTTLVQQTGTSNNIVVNSYATGDSLKVTLILTDISKCKTYRNTLIYVVPALPKMSLNINETKDNFIGESFQIFPNPANDKISITINGFDLSKKYKANIYSINDLIIKTIPVNKNAQIIDLDDIQNGVYIIELTEGQSSSKSRLIINK